MSLSCTCNEWDGEPGSWFYYPPKDFSKLETKRRKRCKSCEMLIDIGADCLIFERERASEYEIEERLYGDTVTISPYYMCGPCGEIYFNLTEAGFCMAPNESMAENLQEYHELTGFNPKKYEKEI